MIDIRELLVNAFRLRYPELNAETEADAWLSLLSAFHVTLAPQGAFDAMLHALRMIRDADDDCKSDQLRRIPSTARMTINQAIAHAEGTLAHT